MYVPFIKSDFGVKVNVLLSKVTIWFVISSGLIDAVFTSTTPVTDPSAVIFDLGIDEIAFNTCLEEGRYTDNVKDEAQAGAAAGVTGTPGNFLLNTETGQVLIVRGAVPYEVLQPQIEKMLE